MICVAATLADIWTGQGTRWNRRRRWQCERQGTSRVVLQATQLGFTETTWNLMSVTDILGKDSFEKKQRRRNVSLAKGGFFWNLLDSKKKKHPERFTEKLPIGIYHVISGHKPTQQILLAPQKKPCKMSRWQKNTKKNISFWTHQKKMSRLLKIPHGEKKKGKQSTKTAQLIWLENCWGPWWFNCVYLISWCSPRMIKGRSKPFYSPEKWGWDIPKIVTPKQNPVILRMFYHFPEFRTMDHENVSSLTT